jgi:acetoin:2,6-dichlorophenolindophenol oxidoreductase subunit beta
MRVVEEINRTLHKLMSDYEDLIIIGEDILDPYGGAFKVTKGLSTTYPERVITTPISEASLIGFASGLAMQKKPVIAEIMFGDFLGLAFDQIINHISKFVWMFNEVNIPLIIRTPMGGGRGYGPTHSQSIEKHFCGIAGLNVFAIDQFMDIEKTYCNFLESKKPTLIIENKILYSRELKKKFEFPTHDKPDVICLAYGSSLEICINAAKKLLDSEEILIEVIPIRKLSPIDSNFIKNLKKRSKKFLFVEEAGGGWGFGEVCSSYLVGGENIEVSFVKGPNHPIPSSKKWELNVLPNEDRVSKEIINLFNK